MHLPNDPWEADVPRNVFSDWLKCPWGWWRKCDERLTGGEGEAEWKEAELPRDPGIFTGAELCSKLPPGQRTHREDGYVWPWSMGPVQEFRAEGVRFPFSSLSPLGFPLLLIMFHSPLSLYKEHWSCHPMNHIGQDPPEFNGILFHRPKQQKVFWAEFSPYQSREDEFGISG